MNKYDILIAIKEIQCRYSLPAFEKNFTDKDYTCKQYEKLVINLANQQEEKDKENERLNNVINELDKLISIKIIREANEEDYHIDINDMVEIKTKLKELKEGK